MGEVEVTREPVAALTAGRLVTVDLGWRRRTRVVTTLIALLLGLGFVGAVLLEDVRAYHLVCEPRDQACVLTEHHLFSDETITVPFRAISDVGFDSGGVDEDGNPGGLHVLVLRRFEERSLTVAPDKPVNSIGLNADALRTTTRSGGGRYEHYATAGMFQTAWMLGLFGLLALAVIARLQWRRVLRWDPSTATLALVRHRWPLPSKPLERATLGEPLRVVLRKDGSLNRLSVAAKDGEAMLLDHLIGDDGRVLAKAQQVADALGAPLDSRGFDTSLS